MANFALIFACLGLGLLFQRMRRTPANLAHSLSHYIVYVSLPAVTLVQIHELKDVSLFPVAMPWLVLGLAVVLFSLLGRVFGWSRATIGALALCAGLGNTSFVGFPLIEALYGHDALRVAILTDQPGSFLAVSTAGMLIIALCSGRSISGRAVVRKILSFPPFLALLVALCWRPFPMAEFLRDMLDKLGATLIPLALVSVGLQLKPRLEHLRRHGRMLAAGLAYKLALAPAVIAGLYLGVAGLRGLALKVSVVESAMAPMVTAAILASEYEMQPELASLLVGVGIPLSLITAPAWAWLVRAF